MHRNFANILVTNWQARSPRFRLAIWDCPLIEAPLFTFYIFTSFFGLSCTETKHSVFFIISLLLSLVFLLLLCYFLFKGRILYILKYYNFEILYIFNYNLNIATQKLSLEIKKPITFLFSIRTLIIVILLWLDSYIDLQT